MTFLLTTPHSHTNTTGLCILSAYLVKAYKFYYLPEYVLNLPSFPCLPPSCPSSFPPSLPPSHPRSAAAILVGLIVGGLARLFSPSKDELDFLSFRPELFFFLFLPPIIFEAGEEGREGGREGGVSNYHATSTLTPPSLPQATP